MKKRLQKLIAVSAAIVGCWSSNAWAQTLQDLETAGWTKVESIESADVSNSYFMFVDAGGEQLAIVGMPEGSRPRYKTIPDPIANPSAVWTLESNSDTYAIRNMDSELYLNGGSLGWNNSMQSNNETSSYKFALADGKYSLTRILGDNGDGRLVGPWNGTDGANDNEEVASNKANMANAPGFYLYTISRSAYATQRETTDVAINVTSKYVTNPDFDSNLNGWTTEGTQRWYPNGKGFDGKASFIEFCDWGKAWSGSITQTVTSLPQGVYRVKALAQASPSNTTVTLSANEQSSSLHCIDAVGGNVASDGSVVVSGKGVAGWQYIEVICALSENEELVIKGSSSATSNARWSNLDHIVLEYLGLTEENSLKVRINEKKQEAQALYGYPMSKSVIDDMKAKVDADMPTDLSSMQTALNGLNQAIADANASILTYENLKATIDKANEIVNSVYVYNKEDKTNYTNAIAEALAAYANGTYTDTQAVEMQKKLWNTDLKSDVLLARPFISSVWSGDVYTNNWSVEADNKTNGSGMTTPFVEYWVKDDSPLGAKEIKAELSGIDAGSYSISTLVRVRIKNGATDDAHGITLQANDGESTDVCNGKTCDDGAQFRYDRYTTHCEVGADGLLNIAFNVAADNNISWLSFKEMKYERVAASSDYEAFNTALETATSKTLGFEQGEYAPYNNTEAIAVLDEAKKIDVTADNKYEDIQTIITRLNAAVWTVNEEEVNAVYNGDFAKCENDGPMQGWQMSNNTLGGAYHSRAYVNDSRLTEFNETKSAAFLRFDGTNSDRGSIYSYGNTAGYTMPLKANTVYCLSADVKGWGSTGKPIRLNLNGPEGFSSWNSQITTEGNADTDDSAPQHFHYVFNTGEYAGNYRISFQVPGSDDNKHNVVVSNISLQKAKAEVSVKIAAGKYATRIFPFAPDFGGADVKVYSCNAKEENGTTLKLEEVATPEANKPYILYSENGCDITVSDYINASETDLPETGYLTGVLNSKGTQITSGYVLQTLNGVQAFYAVSASDAINVPQYRAYLDIPDAEVNALRLVLPGEDDATTISEVAAESETVDVYSLSGVLVRKGVKASEALDGLQKGIYVVNGVKKAVK